MVERLVERVSLAEGGPQLSRLAYGTWRLMREAQRPTPEGLAARLSAIADLGITTIDTAEIYGAYAVEETLGDALASEPGLRARLEIVTKFGIYVPNPRHPERTAPFYNATGKRVIASVDKSLRLLGTDYIDLLLVHRPDWAASADDTAEGLAQVVRAGKVKHVGVSNYNVLSSGAIFDGTLDQCQRYRVRPMAWSPLGGGRLFAAEDEAAVRLRTTMTSLSPKYGGAGPGELALAWVLAHPSGPVAVFGSAHLERIESLARACSLKLDRHDWYLMWQAAAGRHIP
jgi:predicted oxidoreductase